MCRPGPRHSRDLVGGVRAVPGASACITNSIVDATSQVGIAYAIWSGVGTAAIVAIGAVFLGEPVTTVKVAGISLIIAGVVMLNINGTAH